MANPVAFGRDTYCVDHLQPGMFARGVKLVAQRCYRRLITPAGTLRGGEEEADFGMDLAGFVGSTEDRDLSSMLPVRVRNELMKDPTVDSVTVVADRTEAAGKVSYTLTISVESGEGDFDLIVAVDEVTVELLGVN
jgi:hypothetical protein